MKKLIIPILLLISSTIVCWTTANGISGKWSGSVYGPDGKVDVNYNFKADSIKLTGTVEVHGEEMKIDSGCIDDSDIKFSITNSEGIVIPHDGRYFGDSISINLDYSGMKYNTDLTRVVSLTK